jgi:hypothetical protein
MKEKFQMLARVLTAMTDGKATAKDKAKFREDLIATSGDTNKDGTAKTYADYDADERGEIDEVVDALFGLGDVIDTVYEARARLTFKFFTALKKAGFDEKSALLITAHQQNVTMTDSN